MSSDFKIRTIFISNFLLGFLGGWHFHTEKLFFFFCCFVLTIVQQSEYFFLSLSTNCLLHPIFFFRDFYEGIYRTTSKNTENFIHYIGFRRKKWMLKLHGILCCLLRDRQNIHVANAVNQWRGLKRKQYNGVYLHLINSSLNIEKLHWLEYAVKHNCSIFNERNKCSWYFLSFFSYPYSVELKHLIMMLPTIS